MAVDEALLRLCEGPILRIYGWTEPAVSIGYFQKPEVVPPGRPWVRRYTGGGLVDHAADLTYTVVLPSPHPLVQAGTGPCYEALHQAVAHAMEEIGLPVQLAAGNAPENTACFQRPVLYDVVLKQQKVAGAAQRRTRHACLHQGSILLGEMDRTRLSEKLPAPIAQTLGTGTIQPSFLSSAEEELAKKIEAERYSRPEWNLHRE